jgi:hypothetical protein
MLGAPKGGPRSFSRAASVTQRHAADRHHIEADFDPAPVGLVAEGQGALVKGSSRGGIQRRRGHIMLERARHATDMDVGDGTGHEVIAEIGGL